MSTFSASSTCPCGTGQSYDACCGPLHRGERQAQTAVELMRSRYAAYAVDEHDYIFRTWHPRTRPAQVSAAEQMAWRRLTIIDVVAGDTSDDAGEVEFRAEFRTAIGDEVLHERSRFARRAGRWFYLDGIHA